VKDIKDDLGVSLNIAYRIVNTKGFPKIIINGRIYIPKEKYERWIETHTGKNILT